MGSESSLIQKHEWYEPPFFGSSPRSPSYFHKKLPLALNYFKTFPSPQRTGSSILESRIMHDTNYTNGCFLVPTFKGEKEAAEENIGTIPKAV